MGAVGGRPMRCQMTAGTPVCTGCGLAYMLVLTNCAAMKSILYKFYNAVFSTSIKVLSFLSQNILCCSILTPESADCILPKIFL